MACHRDDSTDGHAGLARALEVDSGRVCQPCAEAVGRRSSVDETELRSLFEVLDLHWHDRADERRRRFAGQFEEIEPHAGAAPSASAVAVGTLNIP